MPLEPDCSFGLKPFFMPQVTKIDELWSAFRFACAFGNNSKILQGSLAILGSLSICKITKIHPLRKLESCFSFLRGCSLVKLGSYFILPMLLVISCKRFLTFLLSTPELNSRLSAITIVLLDLPSVKKTKWRQTLTCFGAYLGLINHMLCVLGCWWDCCRRIVTGHFCNRVTWYDQAILDKSSPAKLKTTFEPSHTKMFMYQKNAWLIPSKPPFIEPALTWYNKQT